MNEQQRSPHDMIKSNNESECNYIEDQSYCDEQKRDEEREIEIDEEEEREEKGNAKYSSSHIQDKESGSERSENDDNNDNNNNDNDNNDNDDDGDNESDYVDENKDKIKSENLSLDYNKFVKHSKPYSIPISKVRNEIEIKMKATKNIHNIKLKYQNYQNFNSQDPIASGTEGGQGGRFAFSPKVKIIFFSIHCNLVF